jgi:5-methylthioadenosine/S-adenosylhomocysteine deaminase
MGFLTTRRTLLTTAATAAAAQLVRANSAVAAAPYKDTTQLPQRGSYLIRNAHVVTMDPKLGEMPVGDIYVQDGKIVSVGRHLPAVPGATEIDARRMIAMPGLIDTHWHMWNTLARNMAGEDAKHGYFPMQIAFGDVMTPADSAQGVRLSLAEAINSGITTVHNWSHNLLSPAHADAEFMVQTEMGVRGRFSYGFSRNTPAGAALPLDDVARFKTQWFSHPGEHLMTLGMATRGTQVGPLDIAIKEWAFARNLGIPITTHSGIYPHKSGDIKALGDAGLLGKDVQVIHATNSSPEEFDMLGSTGTHISISPYTEMRTGFGFARVTDMLKLGVPVSLSIDTCALCGNADMFGIMRGIQNVENGRLQSEFALAPRKALEMATVDAALDLGIDHLVGSLTPGKRADLILVKTNVLQMQPLNDVIRTIVQSTQAADVDTVFIDGRLLKRGGALTTIDTERVIREASVSVARIRRAAGLA